MNIKQKQIIKITNKHPKWKDVFLLWLEKNLDLDLIRLESSFTTLIKNKHSLKESVNIKFALNLLNHKDDTNRDIIEKFDDEIKKILHQNKKNQFITSLKTEKYSYLFDDNVVNEINTILDNKITISTIKKHFFNKLARFKNSNDLFISLAEFKSRSIDWDRNYYLNKIKKEQLNVEIVESEENTLMIHVKDYKACQRLGAQSWCIVESKKYFKKYTSWLDRQYIYFDFNLSIEDNKSLIGFTVDCRGSIHYSHFKNDDIVDKLFKTQFKFDEIEIDIFNNYLKTLKSYEHVFIMACRSGLVSLYHKIISERDINQSCCHNAALKYAAVRGHIDIVKLLLKDPSVDASDENDVYFRNTVKNGHIDVAKILLADNRFNPFNGDNNLFRMASGDGDIETVKLLLSYNGPHSIKSVDWDLIWAVNAGHTDIVDLLLKDGKPNPASLSNWAIRKASEKGHPDIVDLLLKDDRVDPSADENQALIYATFCSHIEIINLLLKHKKIIKSLKRKWIISEILITHQDVCLSALNDFHAKMEKFKNFVHKLFS